ncbi:MAG TPA: 16S rRNA processing protein RimM [Alphaproteobacteria bacterium]|nr:16S rRNA processing protein RimM [Alphaproteobacteria bacterium]
MTLVNHILIGRIAAAHGLRGEVKLLCFAADPLAIARYGALMAGDGRSLVLAAARQAGDHLIASFKGVADRTTAEALRGVELYVARAQLPPPEEDEYYLADLIGCSVCGPDGTLAGEVVGVPSFGAGDILDIRIGVTPATGLVPFTRDFVPLVDVAARKIVLSVAGIRALDGADSDDAGDVEAVA